MTQTTMNRRRALTVVAAVPAALALAVPALAMPGEDAELRQLWAKYLAQGDVYREADAPRRERRAAFDAEMGPLYWGCGPDPAWREKWDTLWEKHGMEPLSIACEREHRKHLRIVKAIRKAKAESLFGIGVKLSAWEDWDHVAAEEFAEVIDGVRRDIAALIGDDFIKATDRLAS